jgi:hypothetical protein
LSIKDISSKFLLIGILFVFLHKFLNIKENNDTDRKKIADIGLMCSFAVRSEG